MGAEREERAEQAAGSGGEGQTAVKERPKTSPPKVDKLPPYRVLLHNDDVNEIDYVVRTVIELASLNLQKAVEVTLTAHKRGLALVCITHKERAELYQEQFRSKKLTVTIEPAT